VRVSHRWLTEFLPGLTQSTDELADRLHMLGLLVDDVVRADRGLEAVVLGRVQSVAAHPAADRLKLCEVEVGPGPARRIVCGAPVVKKGAFYPVALPGASLPNGVAVRASEIRGVQSEGMLCSAPELGLEHLGGAEGILELDPEGAVAGAPAAPLLGLDDTIFVLEVPSNRPDWESHLGVARELQELAGQRLRRPGDAAVAAASGAPDPGPGRGKADRVTVRVPDAAGCPRYMGRVIRGVRVAPGPLFAQQRLHSLGVRPVNNVVDATNYVLLELGTPLHAFDLRRVRGGEIVVRRAEPGETLVTLDGKERDLPPGATVIADRDRPIAIGGVMGGSETEVSGATEEIFLEGAFFEPRGIRRTAASLGLRTEASHRFGRGVDVGMVPAGLERASELIRAWAGGSPAAGTADVRGALAGRTALELRPERVSEVTGIEVTRERVREALAAIDLAVEDGGRGLRVGVPGHRFDLDREIDLVEEVARRIGYDRVPTEPLPLRAEAALLGREPGVQDLARRLRELGLDEAYTPTFFDPSPFGEGFYQGRLLEQANPLAQNEPYLRPTLVATLLPAARYNLRRGAPGVAFFETGHVYTAAGGVDEGWLELAQGRAPDGVGQPDGAGGRSGASELPVLPGVRERRTLGIVLAGSPEPAHWSGGAKRREADFYDVKGVVESLVGEGRELLALPSRHGWLHPGQQADLLLDGREAGFLGRLHPRVGRALDLEAAAFVAELDLALLVRPRPPRRFSPPSAFPRVERDLALVVPEERTAAEVQGLLCGAGLTDLVEVHLFDVYRGDQVPAGTRSLAFHLVFQSGERTLTEADVEREMAKLRAALTGAGIRIR
jgi:phenylalanyl-tRNA synthetase beta chain